MIGSQTLYERLLEAALIQFGAFRVDEATIPFALRLEMLASYPAALKLAAHEIAERVREFDGVDRLLCSFDAVAVAALVSQEIDKPLVYADQHGNEAVLVGAYDTGHPTVLIVNTLGGTGARRLIHSARQVGLEVVGVIALIGAGDAPRFDGVGVRFVLDIAEAVALAEDQRRIPPGQAEQVRRWLERQKD